MTLPRLYALTGKWNVAPPVHRMIAMYMGIKREPAPTQANTPQSGEKVNNWDALRGVMGLTVKG